MFILRCCQQVPTNELAGHAEVVFFKKSLKLLDRLARLGNNCFCCIFKKKFENMRGKTELKVGYFSAEESAYVRANYPLMETSAIAKHLNRKVRAVLSHAFQIGVKKVVQGQRRTVFLTPEIVEIIGLIYAEMSNTDICNFLGLSRALLAKHATTVGLKKDVAWRARQLRDMACALPAEFKFKKGHATWSKGIGNPSHPYHKRGIYRDGRHHSVREVGALTVRRKIVGGEPQDYLYVKQPSNAWVPFQIAMWEEYHQQELPAGQLVVFRNGDRNDFTKDNLVALTQGELGLCRGIYGAPYEMLPLVKRHAAVAKAIAAVESQKSN